MTERERRLRIVAEITNEERNTDDNIRYLDEKRREVADRQRDHSPNDNDVALTNVIREIVLGQFGGDAA